MYISVTNMYSSGFHETQIPVNNTRTSTMYYQPIATEKLAIVQLMRSCQNPFHTTTPSLGLYLTSKLIFENVEVFQFVSL
jgi:hypothetical protein